MISSFITVISILIIMICLSSFPIKQDTDPLNDLGSEQIVQDFEKELQEENQDNIKESFNSVEPSSPASAPPGWAVYNQTPFNTWGTHTNSNPVFYEKRAYRKPYRWPFTYTSSFPVEHQSSLDPKF